jgi:hypothetical protein
VRHHSELLEHVLPSHEAEQDLLVPHPRHVELGPDSGFLRPIVPRMLLLEREDGPLGVDHAAIVSLTADTRVPRDTGTVTTLRGTIRSTETREAEGSGDTIGDARAVATEALDLEGFQLLQVITVESKATGESTVRATARSTSAQTHEASGPNYPAALAAFHSSVPDGWQAQHVHEVGS